MLNRIKRIYVDTSTVYGALSQKFGQDTKPFWNAVQRGEIVIVASDVLKEELGRAPQSVRDFFVSLPESQIEWVASTVESDRLAAQYIAENVVGQSSINDCKHIALATINHADVLVAWNFKHIVNIDRIRGYNSVNLKLGYPHIEIRTPREVYYDET